MPQHCRELKKADFTRERPILTCEYTAQYTTNKRNTGITLNNDLTSSTSVSVNVPPFSLFALSNHVDILGMRGIVIASWIILAALVSSLPAGGLYIYLLRPATKIIAVKATAEAVIT